MIRFYIDLACILLAVLAGAGCLIGYCHWMAWRADEQGHES